MTEREPEKSPAPHEQGGEAACFANQLCPDCGVVLDGSPHRPGCTSDEPSKPKVS